MGSIVRQAFDNLIFPSVFRQLVSYENIGYKLSPGLLDPFVLLDDQLER
jgi:hypothetical protein